MSSISAGTTSGTALVSTGDTTGTLDLKTGASATTALSIDASQRVGIGTSSPDALLTVNTIASFGDGAVTTPSIAHKGDLNTGIWFPAADTIAASTGGSERARITSSGVFYLGPQATNFSFTNGSAVDLSGSGTGLAGNGTNLTLGVWNGPIVFQAGNSGGALVERARIDSSGNVGIGVTPGAKLDVYNSAAAAANNEILRLRFTTSVTAGHSGDLNFTNPTGTVVGRISSVCQSATEVALAFGTYSSGIGERMRITSSGNVLIGSPTYTRRLSVKDTTNTVVVIEGSNSGSSNINFADSDSENPGSINYSHSTNYMAFQTAGAERARINSGGKLLLAKTTDSFTSGDGYVFGEDGQAGATSGYTSSAASTWKVYSTGAGAYRFYVGYDGVVNATNTTISAISDQRLKENIRDLDVGLNAIMALKPRKFDWKAGKGKDIKGDRGWIAQEVEQVFPDMVDEWADPAPEGEEPYKSVRADLIPVLVKAIQELKTELDTAKARIAALEAQ